MQRIQWTEGLLENWAFTSYIFFNEKGRIIKQQDFVDYPDYVKADVKLMHQLKKQ